MQLVYLALCVVGTALPLGQFVPWLASNGVDVQFFVQQALANQISTFAWADVLVSAVVLVVFVFVEGRRLGMRRAWLALIGLLVGVSLALPLFLWLRERHLKAAGSNGSFRPGPLRSAA